MNLAKFKNATFIGLFLGFMLLIFSCEKEEELTFDLPSVTLVSPVDSAENISLKPEFVWEAENHSYSDFYFGTAANSLFKEGESLSEASFKISEYTLSDSTTYYWKVVVTNDDGFRESEIRSFRTGN